MSSQAEVLSAEPTSGRSTASIVLSLLGYFLTLGLHFVVLVTAISVTVSVGGIFLGYFDQTQVELPPPTQLAITISLRTANYWYLLLFPGMAIDAALLAILSYYSPRRFRLASGYSQGCLLAVILLFAFLLVAMALPIRTLYEFGGQNAVPAEAEN